VWLDEGEQPHEQELADERLGAAHRHSSLSTPDAGMKPETLPSSVIPGVSARPQSQSMPGSQQAMQGPGQTGDCSSSWHRHLHPHRDDGAFVIEGEGGVDVGEVDLSVSEPSTALRADERVVHGL
jgi:mannose-6-phosphate isomerase-like protein (cupin superfamily)